MTILQCNDFGSNKVLNVIVNVFLDEYAFFLFIT